MFSGNKPQAILEVERELWSALIDISKGEATLPRIQAALKNVEAIVGREGAAEVSGWFSGTLIHYFKISESSDSQEDRETVVRSAAIEGDDTEMRPAGQGTGDSPDTNKNSEDRMTTEDEHQSGQQTGVSPDMNKNSEHGKTTEDDRMMTDEEQRGGQGTDDNIPAAQSATGGKNKRFRGNNLGMWCVILQRR